MQLFDSHCHYNLDPFQADWKQHWAKSQAAGVIGSLVVGTDMASNTEAIAIASQDHRLGATVGFHPNEWDEQTVQIFRTTQDATTTQTEIGAAVALAILDLERIWDDSVIVAIGETGLDYFRLGSYSSEERQYIMLAQQLALIAQLQLAQRKQLPLILHVRDQAETAYWDLLKLLKQESYTGQFILHCVSGPISYVQEAISLGGYVSVAGNVTYKSAEHLRDIVRSVPKDRLLTETDAPFLPPVPFRGKVCEPWMIRHTAEFLHSELNIDPGYCVLNAQTLFPQQFLPQPATSVEDNFSSTIAPDD